MKADVRLSNWMAVRVAVIVLALFLPASVWAQQGHETDPAAALSAALGAACRSNESQFANYLTADNAAAFRALPQEQRTAFLKRFSLADAPGKPLISSGTDNHIVLRCQAPEVTVEFQFGDVRMRENLAFIAVTVVDGAHTEFGLVLETGGWRLLSLGLVLLDIPQLSKQWDEQDLLSREDSALTTLRRLVDAIESYRRAFGDLPESLTQLGPAPRGQISPEQAALVDEQLAAGSSGGYRFRYRILSAAVDQAPGTFELGATPDDYGKTGFRSFLLDGTGQIHGADKHGTAAASDDPVITVGKLP
jgi:hypothetical protein